MTPNIDGDVNTEHWESTLLFATLILPYCYIRERVIASSPMSPCADLSKQSETRYKRMLEHPTVQAWLGISCRDPSASIELP